MVIPQLFGTDGVRGVAGKSPLDPATIARLGAAIVRSRRGTSPLHIVVGRDTRESGPWIERALMNGAMSEGAMVVSVGVVPTPVVAYLARTHDFDLGLMISASHNPYQDNGIKVFSHDGQKFSETEERAVEALVADVQWIGPAASPDAVAGEATTADHLLGDYLDHVRKLLTMTGGMAGARIALDLANGATTTTAPALLRELGFEVIEVGNAPDGRNINLNCGSTHPEQLSRTVVERQCRLGVAFDGDGDRAIFVDHLGRIVDGDALLLILAKRLHGQGTLTGNTVVATVMSNLGFERALGALGIRLVRTSVGDKYVMDEMLKQGYVLGGEQSGHVILAEHLHTGDGLATALAVLRVMGESGRDLAELSADFVPCPQVLVNVRVRERRPIAETPELTRAISIAETELAGRGRLLVRYSGTEPLLRIMIEGDDRKMIDTHAANIAAAAVGALGQA